MFQLIHKRTVRRIRSKYRIRNDEWDKKLEEIALPSPASERYSRLKIIRSNIMYELKRLKAIAEKLDCSGKDYSLDEIIQKYISGTDTGCSVFDFIRAQAAHKKQMGKIRSSETYQTTLNSFMRFREDIDLTFDMIDSELMEHYEAELRRHGLLRNTSSFYMRVLRTNYRLAVEKGLTPDRHPFKHVYCGMDKTVKRSISFAEIKKIKELDLSRKRVMDFARDMFIFSFCTRGMSFIDMAYLKKNDLKHGCLTYRRKKTGQLLVIEWTKQMQDILDKYKPNSTQYLLPIITREDGNERRQYQNQMRKINRRLKDIATSIKLPVPLSLYCLWHHVWEYLPYWAILT